MSCAFIFFFQAEDGIRYVAVTGVQTCALPICLATSWKGISVAAGNPIQDVARRRLLVAGALALAGWSAVAVRLVDVQVVRRSEERRVGKECRSRWSP